MWESKMWLFGLFDCSIIRFLDGIPKPREGAGRWEMEAGSGKMGEIPNSKLQIPKLPAEGGLHLEGLLDFWMENSKFQIPNSKN